MRGTALLAIRITLGVIFCTYGAVKIFGGQFHYAPFTIDSDTVDGTFMVWTFFGYSDVYGRFVGLCEGGAGLLLLFSATRTLGALALFPITLNITVMTFAFRFPGVKWFSLILTVLCGVLVAAEWPKLRMLLWSEERVGRLREAAPAPPDERPAGTGGGSIGRRLVVAVVSVFVLFWINLLAGSVDPHPDPEAMRTHCESAGFGPIEQYEVGRTRYRGAFGIARGGDAEFQVLGPASRRLRVDLHRPLGFVPWRFGQVSEMAAGD